MPREAAKVLGLSEEADMLMRHSAEQNPQLGTMDRDYHSDANVENLTIACLTYVNRVECEKGSVRRKTRPRGWRHAKSA